MIVAGRLRRAAAQQLAARRGLEHAVGNVIAFRGEYIGGGEVEGAQAADVGIHPPSAPLAEQLVAKQIGETGVTSLAPSDAVAEDGGKGQDFARVAEFHARRQARRAAVDIEVQIVSLPHEGGEAGLLQRREFADPKGLNHAIG